YSQIKFEFRIINKGGSFGKYGHLRASSCYLKRFRVDQGGRLPSLQSKGIPLLKKNRKLAPFRADPKPFFPAKGVHMIHDLSGFEQFPIDPAITTALGTIGTTGHYPTL